MKYKARTHTARGKELSKEQIEWRALYSERACRTVDFFKKGRQPKERTFEQFEREEDEVE